MSGVTAAGANSGGAGADSSGGGANFGKMPSKNDGGPSVNSGGMAWMKFIQMIQDVSEANERSGYNNSFAFATDPSTTLYRQGYLGMTPAGRRQRMIEDKQIAEIDAKTRSIQLANEAIQGRMDWQKDVRKHLMGF